MVPFGHEAEGGLLRFTTAGSVDDGKSTLIGRLLYDSNVVSDDQIAALERAAARTGEAEIDLSLLTDGLTAEREQGITIDVAYRYFATPRRKFIIADTPGHEQYTRNMVTGASTADAALILVNAHDGMTVQTRRHLTLAHRLGIPHLVVAVNKMDLVGFDADTFARVASSVTEFAAALGADRPIFVPVSAKFGDNVVHPSPRTPWYEGRPVLAILEELPQASDQSNDAAFRFPVQMVRRAANADGSQTRRYLGRIVSGGIAVGDAITVLPAGTQTRVRAISTFDGLLEVAVAPQSVAIEVCDDLDIARGDVLAHPAARPRVSNRFGATVCWMADWPHESQARTLIKIGTHTVAARIAEIGNHVDVSASSKRTPSKALSRNDIAQVTIQTASPVAFDAYGDNRTTGAFILIDEATNATVAAGMINSGRKGPSEPTEYSALDIVAAEQDFPLA
jgi:sulfate adenylyltransferase large subunit